MSATNIFSSLVSRLNSVFNKAPDALPAFTINSPINGTLIVDDLTISAYDGLSTAPYFLISLNDPTNSSKTISIQNLFNLINSQYSSFKCTNINAAAAGLGSIALVDGTYTLTAGQTTVLNYATSVLWAIFKPLSLVLSQTRDDVQSAIQQLAFSTSSGIFLDYWGSIFGIARFNNEPDLEYSERLLWQTIQPRLNNKAIEQIILNATGVESNIVDMFSRTLIADGYPDAVQSLPKLEYSDPQMIGDGYQNNSTFGQVNDTTKYCLGGQYILGAFMVYLNIPLGYSYYQYTQEQIEEIVNLARAAGTTPFYTVVQTANEIFTTVSTLVESIETAIKQYYKEDRVMFFGHDDFTFYSDHWSANNIPKYPWYQANLQIPSLSDGALLLTKEQNSASTVGSTTSTYFINGFLGDGFLGDFVKDLIIADGAGSSDYYENVTNIASQFIIGGGKTTYVYSPVLLAYQRYCDEPFGPRIVDEPGDDIISIDLSTTTLPARVFSGQSTKSNVAGSSYITYTTPISLVAPVSTTGLKFDAIQLQQENIHSAPIYIPNVNIDNFGTGWNQNYSVTRTWIVPYQDIYGNIYYQQITLPALYPPAAPSLQISNPTTEITADNVLIASGGQVTISWSVTEAATADITETNLLTGVSTTTPISYEGNITFYNLTNDWSYTIIVVGVNGQNASSTVEIHVGSAYTASAPVITMVANPSVCVLCSTNTSIITYNVNFGSEKTETQTFTYPNNTSYYVINPIQNSNYYAIFSPVNNVTVALSSGGTIIPCGIQGLGTDRMIIVPVNPSAIYGKQIEIVYDLSLEGNKLSFNGTDIPVDINTFQITQQVTVELPDPPSINGIPASEYYPEYTIIAQNFATTSTKRIPIAVAGIQQDNNVFQVNSLSPNSIVEAIGSTVNETISISVGGSGFSSNMQVYIVQPVNNGNGTYVGQYLECYLTFLDYTRNLLIFIAPRLTEGTYQVLVQKSDCEGNVVNIDSSQYLTYTPSTYREGPTISSIDSSVVCVGTGFTQQTIVMYGNNYRVGAIVYLVNGSTLTPFTTTVISPTTISFVMNYSTIGEYDLLVVNTDESSFATNNQILDLITPSTLPVFDSYGVTAPIDINGHAYYGSNFNLYWDIDHCNNVTFTSSDANVAASLLGDYPKIGNLSIPIYHRGTTITITGTNPCGNTVSNTVTINEYPASIYTAITPAVSNLLITTDTPYTLHLFATSTPTDSNYSSVQVDITGNSSIAYSFSGSLIYISNGTVAPLDNGVTVVNVQWDGLYANFTITVSMPYVVSLTATPNPLVPVVASGTNILLASSVQIQIIANYSDLTQKDVTSLCRFADYDPQVLSITPSGYATFLLPQGATIINVSYELVRTTIKVGNIDPALVVNALSVTPPYSLATLSSYNVRWQVTGVNNITTVVPTINNISKFSYISNNFGTDLITAYIDDEDIVSNSGAITWINSNQPIGILSVNAKIYNGTTTGTFSATSSTTPVFEQPLSSWILNLPKQSDLNNYPYYDSYTVRPLVDAVIDSSYNCISTDILQANGFQAGVGNLYEFDAAFTGQLIVKNAGDYTFTFNTNDGYIFSIDNGATKISGDYNNIPSNGFSPINNYPIIGGNNIRRSPSSSQPIDYIGTSSIVVNFPSEGVYEYELDYSSGGYNDLVLYVTVDVLSNQTLQTIPYYIDTIPNTEKDNNSVSLSMSPNDSIPNFVGDTQVFTAQLLGNLNNINNSYTTFNLDASNVRDVSLNGNGLYSGDIIDYKDNFQSSLTRTTEYVVDLSNNFDSLSVTAIANILSFPEAVINNFYAFDGLNTSNYSKSSISLTSDNVLGLSWNVSNAVTITLFDSMNQVSYDLPSAGTKYITVPNDGDIIIIAYSADGTFVESQISVDVSNNNTTIAAGNTDIIPTSITNTNSVLIANQTIALSMAVPTPLKSNLTRPSPKTWTYCFGLRSTGPGSTTPGSVVTQYYADATLTGPDSQLVAAFNSGKPLYLSLQLYNTGVLQSPIVVLVTSVGVGAPVLQARNFYYFTYSIDDYGYSQDSGKVGYGITYQQIYDIESITNINTTITKFSDSILSTDGTVPTLLSNGSFNGQTLVDSVQTNSIYQFTTSYVQDYPYTANVYPQYVPEQFTLYAAIDFDNGPSFSYVNISASTVNIGQLVTVSYKVLNAVSLTGDFLNGSFICIGENSFAIRPDRTKTFTLIATSVTGIVTKSTFTINVIPNAYGTANALFPIPSISYIALDGVISTSSQIVPMKQTEGNYTLEIYGNHFLSDRNYSLDIASKVHVLINNLNNTSTSFGLTLISINSISNTYINATIAGYSYTSASIYQLLVINDIGISIENNNSNQIQVVATVPNFIMQPSLTAYNGESIDIYLDYVDPLRDINLVLLINGKTYAPYFIGENSTDSYYVSFLYLQIMGTSIPNTLLNNLLTELQLATSTRLDIYKYILSLQGANTSAITTVGTKISYIYQETATGPMVIQTNQGISDTSVLVVAEPVPPPVVGPDSLTIQGITPTVVEGGATVTIFGYGFTSNTTITIGASVVSATYIGPTEMSFAAPLVTSTAQVNIYAYDTVTKESSTYSTLTILVEDAYVDNSVVIGALFNTSSLQQTLTTISNPNTGQVGNQGQRGSYITQPTYVVNVSGLADLTASYKDPSYGGYQPVNDNSIVSAQFTTTSLNNITVVNPNTISLGILNHVDLSPVY